MNLRLKQRHSSTHWELEVVREDKTQVIHFHQGLGLLGQCNSHSVLEKMEIQSWYKVQARSSEVKAEPGCVWIAFQLSHLDEEVAGYVLDTITKHRKVPLEFFLNANVPALPSYAEVSQWFQSTPKPTWKLTELDRFSGTRSTLIETLYRSIIRLIEPESLQVQEQNFLRDASPEEVMSRAQLMVEDRVLYQVRLASNSWAPVLLTLDADEATAKTADFDELGSSSQLVTLNPLPRDSRVWQVISRVEDSIFLKCQQTRAYGTLNMRSLTPIDLLYISLNPGFKKELEQAGPGMDWPVQHNFLIDLVTEEKMFIWGDLWQLQTVSGVRTHRLQLKHYREIFPLHEPEQGMFKLPAQTNQEGLGRALQKAGYFRRESEGRMRLIDPELCMELGLP